MLNLWERSKSGKLKSVNTAVAEEKERNTRETPERKEERENERKVVISTNYYLCDIIDWNSVGENNIPKCLDSCSCVLVIHHHLSLLVNREIKVVIEDLIADVNSMGVTIKAYVVHQEHDVWS